MKKGRIVGLLYRLGFLPVSFMFIFAFVILIILEVVTWIIIGRNDYDFIEKGLDWYYEFIEKTFDQKIF